MLSAFAWLNPTRAFASADTSLVQRILLSRRVLAKLVSLMKD